jgi:hypothetical protein
MKGSGGLRGTENAAGEQGSAGERRPKSGLESEGGDQIRFITMTLKREVGLPRNGYHNVRRSARTPYAMSVAVPTPPA